MPCMNCTSASLASTLDRSTASLTSIFRVDSPGRPGCRSGGLDSEVLWTTSAGLGSDLSAIDWHEMAEIHTAKTMIRYWNIVDVKVYTVNALNSSSCTRHRWRALKIMIEMGLERRNHESKSNECSSGARICTTANCCPNVLWRITIMASPHHPKSRCFKISLSR